MSLGSNVIDPENFNFDTDTETFIIGDLALGPEGQLWNRDGPGVGFGSGRQALAT